MPVSYVRVLLQRVRDPQSRDLVRRYGEIVRVIDCEPADPRQAAQPLVLVEFRNGARDVFRPQQLEAASCCACGCGEVVNHVPKSRASAGLVRGQPRRYKHGHNARKKPPARLPKKPPNPSGLCRCGCGQMTERTGPLDVNKGWGIGWYRTYIRGHNLRMLIAHDRHTLRPRMRTATCRAGHPYTEDTRYVYHRGGKEHWVCRVCRRIRDKKRSPKIIGGRRCQNHQNQQMA